MRRTTAAPIQIKIARLLYILILITVIIAIRLAYLQIHLSHEYLTQSRKNFLRHKTITPPRGNIVDINKQLLVTNRPVINLYWQGTIKKIATEEIHAILDTLNKILDPIAPDILLQEIQKANKLAQRHPIAHDLSFEQLSKIKEQFPNHENLVIETGFERFYPHHAYASHILGYLGRIDIDSSAKTIGKMGLEELLEESLKGHPGAIMTTINSLGTQLSHVELQRALSGNDIHTTIDLSLQEIAETIFPADCEGSIILMNPITGALQAVVSRPNFDPNIFVRPMTSALWQELQTNQPFLNRAFKACYPPGSIFKLITASAALELGLITQSDTINCRGYYTFAQRQYWCHQKHGHGVLDVAQAVAQSCNILFFEIGKRIDINILAQYAHKFGLGEKTNILFSEKTGVVPSRAWKKAEKGEPWWPGETLSVSIGQSFLLVTPIQIARMISAIFTGYLVNPRILVSEPIITQPINISPSTLSFLRETMRAVVTEGTGRRVSHIKNIEIYAKTSTAQVSDLSKREQSKEHREHGWFVSYIQYKNNPPLTMIILLEHVSSSKVATNVAKQFLLQYKKLIDEQKHDIL